MLHFFIAYLPSPVKSTHATKIRISYLTLILDIPHFLPSKIPKFLYLTSSFTTSTFFQKFKLFCFLVKNNNFIVIILFFRSVNNVWSQRANWVLVYCVFYISKSIRRYRFNSLKNFWLEKLGFWWRSFGPCEGSIFIFCWYFAILSK